MRIANIAHGTTDRAGFLPTLIALAKEKGVVGYHGGRRRLLPMPEHGQGRRPRTVGHGLKKTVFAERLTSQLLAPDARRHPGTHGGHCGCLLSWGLGSRQMRRIST
ncbi:hypothetical protein ACFV2L_35625 [Streptomyces sp. NPDC059687]|uniref:hypothetical protein n=1 Tax=Streptomyces sp. NPDC059687 TaxID=3346905 RepID=UPI0036A2CCED